MRRVQRSISPWKQPIALLLCFVMVMSAGWTGAFAETEASPEIPEPPESDLLADVETSADWDELFANLSLSGNWAGDLVNVAKSQLGYTESIRNFKAVYAEDRNAYDLYGWNRYGAWYGEPYGEWNAMFVSFCLFYAGVSSDAVPYDSDPGRWAVTLTGRGLYHEREAYTAAPGNLIFFDRDGDGRADRMGIVSEVNRETGAVNCIEGGRSGRVDIYGYAPDTEYIMGYVSLPANPDAPAAAQPQAGDPSGQPAGETTGNTTGGAYAAPAKAEDDFVLVAGFAGNESGVTIYLEAGSGSVPPDTMWTLSPINGNQIKGLVKSAADGEVLETRALHVLLHDQFGNTVEAKKPMRFRLYPTSWNYTADHILVLQILDDNTVNIVARADDFREIATSGIRFEAKENGIYAVVNVA